MRLLKNAARLATIALLLGSTAALSAPVASAAPAAMQDGWVRCAHLSPDAPAMDIYMYPFGDAGRRRAGVKRSRARHEFHGERADGLHRGRHRSRSRPAGGSAAGPDDGADGQGARPGHPGLA